MTSGGRYILISTLFFSLMQICIKQIEDMPTSQVVFFRAIVSLVICSTWLRYRKIPLFGTHRKWLVARGVAGTIALFLFFYSVQQIPLASAVTLQYLSPVFTVIIATIAFRESGSIAQWFFLLFAFVGVLFIQGFDSRVSPFMAMVCIVSAVFSAIAYNIIRKIGVREHPLVIVFYFPLVTTVVLGPVAFVQWRQPIGVEWVYLLLIGVFVHFAQVFMTQAYQNTKAADIVTLKYVGSILALAIGFFGYGETYSYSALLGMLMVIVGAIGANRVTSRLRLRGQA